MKRKRLDRTRTAWGTEKIILCRTDASWLMERNHNYRNRSIITLRKYATDLRTGRWRDDEGNPMMLTVDQRFVDGQHRAGAVVMTGIAMPVTMMYGCSESSHLQKDGNRPRSDRDRLRYETISRGEAYNQIAKSHLPVASLIYFGMLPTRRNRPSYGMKCDIMSGFQEGFDFISTLKGSAAKLGVAGAYAAFLLASYYEDHGRLRDLWEVWISGSPVDVLSRSMIPVRDWMLRTRAVRGCALDRKDACRRIQRHIHASCRGIRRGAHLSVSQPISVTTYPAWKRIGYILDDGEER